MSLSKSKCWYLNNYLHFSKRVVPLKVLNGNTWVKREKIRWRGKKLKWKTKQNLKKKRKHYHSKSMTFYSFVAIILFYRIHEKIPGWGPWLLIDVKAMFPLEMFLRQKHQWQRHTIVTIVLALSTLGDAAQIEMILIAKASKEGGNPWCFHQKTSPMYTSLKGLTSVLWTHWQLPKHPMHCNVAYNMLLNFL
jgi:hypothetical protein